MGTEVIYECSQCGYPVSEIVSNCPMCGSAFSPIGSIGSIGALPNFGWTEVFLTLGVGMFGGYILSGILSQAPDILKKRTIK